MRMPQTVGRRARFQARIDLASFLCLDHDPSFGLPRLAGWDQVWVGVAGMYLYGKHLVCVKKFEQQGKAAEARSKLPHQLFSKLFHQSTDSLALKRSIRNLALMVRSVAKHPRFADRPITRKRRGEQTGQATAAPQTVLIDRVEPQRIQSCLAHWCVTQIHSRRVGT